MADPEVMWDWLRAYGVPFYDTFWWVNGIEEYKKIYGRSYAEELRTRGISPEDPAFKAVWTSSGRRRPTISAIPI